MDLFETIRKMPGVIKVSNFYEKTSARTLDFFFFICPRMKSSGLRVNELKTGLVAEYVKGKNKSTVERLAKVSAFIKEFQKLNIPYTLTAVLASADALILFPIPVPKPPLEHYLATNDNNIANVRTISNYEIVLKFFPLFGELYYKKPWTQLPQKILRAEKERLESFFTSRRIPENLIQDFIRRIFAGFALDGILAQRGHFGINNPVLLGVESPGVAMLQNAALSRDQWLPVIQL